MMNRRKKALFAGALAGCCCLFAVGAVSAVENAPGDAGSPGGPAGDAAPDEQQNEGKHEDFLDRVFSPLDDAVSDINRDMNKGDDSASPDASE